MNRTALSLAIIELLAAVGCQQQHEPYFLPKVVDEHAENGVGSVGEYDCEGHTSTQAKAEAWIRTIPVGTTRAKAIDALKKRGFFMGVLREPNRFSMLKIIRPGFRVYLVAVVGLDVSAHVTQAKIYLLDADDSFRQGPFSTTAIGNTP